MAASVGIFVVGGIGLDELAEVVVDADLVKGEEDDVETFALIGAVGFEVDTDDFEFLTTLDAVVDPTTLADGAGATFRDGGVFGESNAFEVVTVGFTVGVDFAVVDRGASCCRMGELVMFNGGEDDNWVGEVN